MQKETNAKRTLEKNAVCCKNVIRTDKNKNFLPVTAHLGCNSFVEEPEQEKEENESEHVHLLHKIVMRVLLEDHSTNVTYVNDLRIGRGRRCELKNGDDIAIVLLPEKRSRRSDDSLPNIKMSNNDDGKDEERLGEQNNRVVDNSKTNNNASFNTFSDKSQNKLPSNQGDAHERTKPRNKNNENQSQVEIANTRESKVKWISDIADERTYLERFCFHLYPKENAIEMKSNQSCASVHVDSSTVSSANSGNMCINNTMSPLCIDHYESASHISDKLISHDNIDSNKVKENNIITDKANNTSHVSPSHPLSMPSAIRMNGKDNDLVVQQQQQPPPQQQSKRGQNWFNDVRDNFIAPQRASSRLRDASPAVLSSSSLVASTLGRLTPLLTPANNNQANLASNVVNYSIMPRRPLQWGPCIGSGASGKVHLGIDVTSSKLVAIKVLKGTRLSSKSQERNSMSSLRTNSSNSYSSSSNNINNNNYSSSNNNNSNNTNDDNDRNEQERKRVKTGESSCLSDDHQVIAMDEEEQYSRRNNINEDNNKEHSISSSSSSGKCSNERSKSISNSDSSSILSISDISVTNTHDSDNEDDNNIVNNNNNNIIVEEEEAKILYENKAEVFHANSSESNTNTAHYKNSKEQVHCGCKRHDGCAHGLDESSDVESNTDITNVLTPAHVREL